MSRRADPTDLPADVSGQTGSPNSESSRPQVMAAWLMAAAAVAVAVLVTRGANRGFGMVDEGFYLVTTSRGVGGVTWFGAMVNRLLPWACDDIVALRHVRLALLLAASVGFGTAAWRWAGATGMGRTGPVSRLHFVATSFLGASLGYAWLPQTLNYNDLNEAGSLVAGAALLLILARPDGRPDERPSAWLLAACGCAQTLQFFVKPPSAALGAVVVLVILLWVHPRARLRVLACYTLGAVAGLALFFTLVAGPRTWWTELRSSLSAVSGSSHGTERLLARYAWDLRLYAARVAAGYGPFVLLAPVLTLWLRRRSAPDGSRARTGCAAIVVAALAVAGWRQEFASGPHGIRFESLMPYVALLAAAGACAAVSAWCDRAGPPVGDASGRRARIAGIAWLALAPAVAAFGTNNHIVTSMTGHLAAWFVLATVLASRLSRRPTAFPGALGTAALCVAAACAHVWGGYMAEPRGLAAPRLEQVTGTALVPRLRGLLLDPPTRDLHEGLWKALHAGGFAAGDPIIGLFDHPALVFTMDGSYPGVLWPVGGPVENGRVNLDLAPREAVERSFLLVDSGATALEATRLLQAAELPFPDGYRALGTFPNPFTGGTLTAYAPPLRLR